MYKSTIAIRVGVIFVSLILSGCAKKLEESSAYRAACEGPPLTSAEMREQAMMDGYEINRQYNCIDKASFAAVKKRNEEWEAYNTPEAKAKRESKLAEQRARAAEDEFLSSGGESHARKPLLEIRLREIDVNVATVEDIANVISVGPDVAAQIAEERKKRHFSDWADLTARVIGLSAAQNAAEASVCGLTVDGKSLDGAPPNEKMAALIYEKYLRYQKKS